MFSAIGKFGWPGRCQCGGQRFFPNGCSRWRSLRHAAASATRNVVLHCVPTPAGCLRRRRTACRLRNRNRHCRGRHHGYQTFSPRSHQPRHQPPDPAAQPQRRNHARHHRQPAPVREAGLRLQGPRRQTHHRQPALPPAQAFRLMLRGRWASAPGGPGVLLNALQALTGTPPRRGADLVLRLPLNPALHATDDRGWPETQPGSPAPGRHCVAPHGHRPHSKAHRRHASGGAVRIPPPVTRHRRGDRALCGSSQNELEGPQERQAGTRGGPSLPERTAGRGRSLGGRRSDTARDLAVIELDGTVACDERRATALGSHWPAHRRAPRRRRTPTPRSHALPATSRVRSRQATPAWPVACKGDDPGAVPA